MRHGSRTLATTLAFVLAFAVLGLPQAAAAVTSPADGAAAKASDFVIVPPWQAGESHSVKCGYGCGKHQNIASTGAPNDHYGLDFDLGSTDAVYPVADGTVIYAGPGLPGATTGWTDYGDLVYVQHDGDYSSLYAHLGSIDVEAGDPVTTDEPLGQAGESGTEGGVHLHFALYRGATDSNGMPHGGVSVVPEPFSQCSGDCDDLVYGSTLTRVAGDSSSDPTTARPPEDKPPVARPEAIPARVPWSAGQAHRVTSRYYTSNPEGAGLLVELAVPDSVYPLYAGEVIHAGCATGRSAPLGRSVFVRTQVNGHTYDAVYGHLASIDPGIAGASALTPVAVGPNQPLGTAGTLTDVDLEPCPGELAGPDRLYVGILRDAELLPGGELSGGRAVYPEPLIGRGAYEGFTWWTGPATAIDLAPGIGKPTGRWASKSAKDGQDITFGDPVTLVAKVKDSVPIREVRFTAYYPDWAREKSAARLSGFDPKGTWRILAVCRPPKVGGEPKKSKGCQWDGTARNATVTYTWDPAAQEKEKPAPWQPIPRTAMTLDSSECLPVSLSFDIYDSAGHRALGPAGAKIVQRCRKPTDKPGVVVNLQPLQPPAAPANVRLTCPPKREGHAWGPDGEWYTCFKKGTLKWEDRADNEDEYRVYARMLGGVVRGDPCKNPRWEERQTGWVEVGSVPSGATTWAADFGQIWESLDPDFVAPTVEFRVSAANRAGESKPIQPNTSLVAEVSEDVACP